ncbi:hypothetical protein OG507_26240 [Streptomyces sp. NBC_01217]|nr:hypothetical protein OG507_26240 [Streptomyces sp. NBC_01217]
MLFAEANRFGADYRMVLLSPTGAYVISSLEIRIGVDNAATSAAAHTLMVSGTDL